LQNIYKFQKLPNKMDYIKILNSKEKKQIVKWLHEQFGVEEINGILIKSGKDRLFFFSGDLTESEIKDIENAVPIERVGVYFARIIDDDVKLSIEGSQILSGQIKKNIFELNKEQLNDWMNGRDLQFKSDKRGFYVIKYQDDFLGCGKFSAEKIGNFIPKARRLKNKEI
jgi:NOL1/NOP2/fmu family ribosome biogenesis protein